MQKQVLLKKADSRVRGNFSETMTAELSPVEWLDERQWGTLSISERSQKFQAELLLLWGWMLVSGTEYLDWGQVERAIYSTRQDYIHRKQLQKKETSALILKKYLEHEVS